MNRPRPKTEVRESNESSQVESQSESSAGVTKILDVPLL